MIQRTEAGNQGSICLDLSDTLLSTCVLTVQPQWIALALATIHLSGATKAKKMGFSLFHCYTFFPDRVANLMAWPSQKTLHTALGL